MTTWASRGDLSVYRVASPDSPLALVFPPGSSDLLVPLLTAFPLTRLHHSVPMYYPLPTAGEIIGKASVATYGYRFYMDAMTIILSELTRGRSLPVRKGQEFTNRPNHSWH
jgi:hypothetical protein